MKKKLEEKFSKEAPGTRTGDSERSGTALPVVVRLRLREMEPPICEGGTLRWTLVAELGRNDLVGLACLEVAGGTRLLALECRAPKVALGFGGEERCLGGGAPWAVATAQLLGARLGQSGVLGTPSRARAWRPR